MLLRNLKLKKKISNKSYYSDTTANNTMRNQCELMQRIADTWINLHWMLVYYAGIYVGTNTIRNQNNQLQTSTESNLIDWLQYNAYYATTETLQYILRDFFEIYIPRKTIWYQFYILQLHEIILFNLKQIQWKLTSSEYQYSFLRFDAQTSISTLQHIFTCQYASHYPSLNAVTYLCASSSKSRR